LNRSTNNPLFTTEITTSLGRSHNSHNSNGSNVGSIRLFLDVLLLLLLLLCELPDLTDYFRAEKDRSQFASENNDLRAAMDHVSAEKVVTPPPPVLDAALPDCMKHTA